MTEQEWLAGTDPQAKLNYIFDRASDRKVRLLGIACCYAHWHALPNEECRRAVDTAERKVEGRATEMYFQVAVRDVGEFLASLLLDLSRHNDNTCTGRESEVAVLQGLLIAVHGRDYRFRWGVAGVPLIGGSDCFSEVFGNPFRPVPAEPRWLTSTAISLARTIYYEKKFDRLPILADALEEAGCDDGELLAHCRGDRTHVRGCWAVDLVLGKE